MRVDNGDSVKEPLVNGSKRSEKDTNRAVIEENFAKLTCKEELFSADIVATLWVTYKDSLTSVDVLLLSVLVLEHANKSELADNSFRADH